MFLHEIPGSSLVELDFLHASGYQSAYRERKCVLDAFKTRFRNEYLSFLVHRGKEKSQHQFKLGDVVLVEADNKKRWEWPMGRIVELIPGRDGHVRTARVKVAHGILLRPIQRLYPMEISSPEAAPAVPERKQIQETEVRDPELKTRSGRQIKKPDRLGFNDKVN
jgi:hypothetical protein